MDELMALNLIKLLLYLYIHQQNSQRVIKLELSQCRYTDRGLCIPLTSLEHGRKSIKISEG